MELRNRMLEWNGEICSNFQHIKGYFGEISNGIFGDFGFFLQIVEIYAVMNSLASL